MLLQGPSRGEEASKKLLAVGSALKAKPRRPQGLEEKACLQQGIARARSSRRALSCCCTPLTCFAGLTFREIWRGVVRVNAAQAPPAAADRALLSARPAGALAAPRSAACAQQSRSSPALTSRTQAQASPTPQQPAKRFLPRQRRRHATFPRRQQCPSLHARPAGFFRAERQRAALARLPPG